MKMNEMKKKMIERKIQSIFKHVVISFWGGGCGLQKLKINLKLTFSISAPATIEATPCRIRCSCPFMH